MSWLSKPAFVEPLVDWVHYESIATTEDTFFEVDLYTVKKEDLNFSNSYSLKMMRDDTIHGIVTWFDIFFGNMQHHVKFSTGPYDERTHWKQTVFYFNGSYSLRSGDVISGSIACKKSSENFRAWDIKVSYHFRQKRKQYQEIDSQVIQYKLR